MEKRTKFMTFTINSNEDQNYVLLIDNSTTYHTRCTQVKTSRVDSRHSVSYDNLTNVMIIALSETL